MSALRWLWRTDGATMGLAAAVWFADAVWDGDWLMAIVWALFALWFALHVLRPGGRTYDFLLTDGQRVTMTTRKNGSIVSVAVDPVR